MKQIVLLLILPVFAYAQSETTIINPKGKWYFGAEIGWNHVTSFKFDEGKNSVSAGILAEYHFAKQWSIQGRVKYMKTGASYLKKPSNGWNFNWIRASEVAENDYPYYNRFDGHAIVIPINVKWQFRLVKNLHGNLKLGPALQIETKSSYQYNVGDTNDYSKTFVNLNFGQGFNYYFSERYSAGIDVETYVLGNSKGTTASSGLWTKETHYATNINYSLQFKYHF